MPTSRMPDHSHPHLDAPHLNPSLTWTRLRCHLGGYPSPTRLCIPPSHPQHLQHQDLPKCMLVPLLLGLTPSVAADAGKTNPPTSLLLSPLPALAHLPIPSPLLPQHLHQMLQPLLPLSTSPRPSSLWVLLGCTFCLERFISYLCGPAPSLHSAVPSGAFSPAQPEPLPGAPSTHSYHPLS